MATIAEIRQKYPQYSDMSDSQLADALHSKFYADMPRDQFNAKIGFSGEQSPSALDQLGHQVGLTARYGIEGLASPFATLADVPRAAENLFLSKEHQVPEYNQSLSDMLTKAGLPQPQGAGERIVGDMSRGLASVGSGAGIGRVMAKAASPVVAGIGTALQSALGTQAVSGATSGAASGTAREEGLPLWAQLGAGLAGGALPFAPMAARELFNASAANDTVRPQATDAISRGYSIPPIEATEKPGAVASLASGGSGKIKLAQAASVKNQEVTNDLVASELGLQPGQTITKSALETVRAQAGRAKDAIKTALPVVSASPNTPAGFQFKADIAGVAGVNPHVAAFFPNSVKNEDISNLVKDLGNITQMSTDTALESVRHFRAQAVGNLKTYDPAKNALGLAQRKAADAIDTLIENSLAQSGKQDLVAQYRGGRQLQAKTYDVEKALNEGTGDISAQKLAGLANAGRPLSGNLKTVADTFSAFPRAMQSPSKFGGEEPHSILDTLAAATAAASGHPGVGAAIFMRPGLRQAVLAPGYQKLMAGIAQGTKQPIAIPALNALAPAARGAFFTPAPFPDSFFAQGQTQ